jgi:hypothetical protein
LLLLGLFGLVVGSFDELAFLEPRTGASQHDEVRGIDSTPAGCAASMSLNAIAMPATRDPGPLITRCRNLTMAKVDSINPVFRTG